MEWHDRRARDEINQAIRMGLADVDAGRFRPYRTGIELLRAVARVAPRELRWRRGAYEFVADRPAIDLLTGGPDCRTGLDALTAGGDAMLNAWIGSWAADEESFRRERRAILLYPETEEDAA